MSKCKYISRLFCLISLLLMGSVTMRADHDNAEDKGKLDVKEVIFEHLGDGYGWEVPFAHQYRIPLPVIVRAEDGTWHSFSSARLTELVETVNAESGEIEHHISPVPVTIERDGKKYVFYLSQSEAHKNKVVQLLPVDVASQQEGAEVDSEWVSIEGKEYTEYKPFDISITKNVLALFISALVVVLLVMAVVRWYKRNGMKAPRGGKGFLELIVEFVYDGVIKNTLGAKAPKYAPYLLTAFFFILIMNLLGLIVIFPGGANLTGNIAVTIVLALLTFVITNIKGSKHYWKEIFWPDVPIWLKCPLPIMQFIEIFGIFTKPAALCVRLFANMMGGHMIVITLILLIFIFGAFGAVAAGGVTVVSLIFSIFMLLLDVLVSFIQAYVFTMLSTIFIYLSTDEGHGEHSNCEHETIADSTISRGSESISA